MNRYIILMKNSFISIRVFPYFRYLIVQLPFFALLIYHNVIHEDLKLILYVIPFIISYAMGFIYNTICDASKDPKDKNPITRGDLPKKIATALLIILLFLALISFALIYKSMMAILLSFLYLFIWLAYSGINVRFKESFFAPIVASIVLWVGAPLILLAEFNYFGLDAVLLLVGFFIIYIGHEIKHTVIEYVMDKKYNCQTFAVKLGRKFSTIIEYLCICIGYIFLLSSLYVLSISYKNEYTLMFTILFALALALTIIYGYLEKFNIIKDTIFVTSPYIVAKIYIIFYTFVILNLPLLYIVFIILICL